MTSNGDEPLRVVPVRHVGRWFAGAGVIVIIAMMIHTFLSKIPTGQRLCHVVASSADHKVFRCVDELQWRFSWDVVGKYVTSANILKGLLMTLALTGLTMVIGVVLGATVAIMRLSASRILVAPAWLFTWFFRGTPVYVQLLFWFNIAAIFPTIDFGIPFGPSLWHIEAVNLFTPFTAALVGLGLNEGAYMSEIIRGGILAVDEGQVEAANSVGLSRLQTLRLVVLPQAMRVIIPPTGNEVISMLKTSSLASALAVVELLKAAQNVYARTYEVIPLLIVASIWYLIVTTILSIGQFYIERHFSKGSLRNLPMTPWERIVRDSRGVVGKMRTPRGLRGVRA